MLAGQSHATVEAVAPCQSLCVRLVKDNKAPLADIELRLDDVEGALEALWRSGGRLDSLTDFQTGGTIRCTDPFGNTVRVRRATPRRAV